MFYYDVPVEKKNGKWPHNHNLQSLNDYVMKKMGYYENEQFLRKRFYREIILDELNKSYGRNHFFSRTQYKSLFNIRGRIPKKSKEYLCVLYNILADLEKKVSAHAKENSEEDAKQSFKHDPEFVILVRELIRANKTYCQYVLVWYDDWCENRDEYCRIYPQFCLLIDSLQSLDEECDINHIL